MSHRICRAAASLSIWLLAALPGDAFAADPITDARILELIKRVDDAVVQRDIPALLACFADDAAIQSNWLSPEGASKKEFTRQERERFLSALRAWAAVHSLNLDVRVPDASARRDVQGAPGPGM